MMIDFNPFKLEYEIILCLWAVFLINCLIVFALAVKLVNNKNFPKLAGSYKLNLARLLLYAIPLATLIVIANFGYRYLFVENYHFIDVTNISYTAGTRWIDPIKPITFTFDRPMDFAKAKYDVSPALAGNWQEDRQPVFPWVRSLTFTPTQTPSPNIKYEFYISGLKKLNAPEEAYDFSFEALTYKQQSVVEHSFEEDRLFFKFSENVDDPFSSYHLDINPYLPGEFVHEKGGVYYQFKQAPASGIRYEFTLKRGVGTTNLITGELISQENIEDLYDGSFTTPLLSGFKTINTNLSQLGPNQPLEFDYDQQLKQEDLAVSPPVDFKLKFGVEGGGYYIVPDDVWPENGNFKLTIKNSKTLQFTTNPSARIVTTAPADREINVSSKDVIKIYFSMDVDAAQMQSLFQISPTVAGKFNYKARMLTFTPDAPLTYSQSYTVTLQGLDNFVFTTSQEMFALNVPLIYQERKFECNTTAAAMVLNYFGINKTKEEVFAEIPKETALYDHNLKIWGDPQKGYVGDIDGNERGYGIHWEPIAKYISQFRQTRVITHGTTAEVIKEITAGHPVMVWWQNGRSTPNIDIWHTVDGKEVRTVNGMHTEVAKGFIGTLDHPTHILLSDPWRGEHKVTIAEFERLWAYYDNSAVVTY
jgi:uncharacterized protein YvpB